MSACRQSMKNTLRLHKFTLSGHESIAIDGMNARKQIPEMAIQAAKLL